MALRTDQMERELRRRSSKDIFDAMHPSTGSMDLKKVVNPDGTVEWKYLAPGQALGTGARAEGQLGHAPKVFETPEGGLGLVYSDGRTVNLGMPSSPENRRTADRLAKATLKIGDKQFKFEEKRGEVDFVNNSEATFMYIPIKTPEGGFGLWGGNDEWKLVELPPIMNKRTGKRITARDVSAEVGRGGTKTIEDVLRLIPGVKID